MSPPQVNLCGKPTPPVVSMEETLIEKEDKTDIDSLISVETRGRSFCQCSRRCHLIICLAVLVLVSGTVAVVLGVKFGWRHHDDDSNHDFGKDYVDPPPRHDDDRYHAYGMDYDYPRCGIPFESYYHYNTFMRNCTSWSCLYGKERITENVWADEELLLIFAEHAHGSHEEPSMHILHDYQNGWAAYKDTERNVCYITVLNETFQEGVDRWHSYELTGRDPKILRLLSDKCKDLAYSAGTIIYGHCMHGQCFWAQEIEEMDVDSSMTIVKV